MEVAAARERVRASPVVRSLHELEKTADGSDDLRSTQRLDRRGQSIALGKMGRPKAHNVFKCAAEMWLAVAFRVVARPGTKMRTPLPSR